MKKILALASFFGVAIAASLFAPPARADTYRNPSFPYDFGYKAGDCIMVTTRAEADTTHVYTLNPSNTVGINNSYLLYWNRNARCDELQFHVDHNTSGRKLNQWLGSRVVAWYKNMKASPYEGKTMSRQDTGWFLIKDGVAHKIPDWLTGLSWGLLLGDKQTIGAPLRDTFTKYVKVGAPLNFSSGPYADEIRGIWKDGNRDFSSLPTRLASEISTTIEDSGPIFTPPDTNVFTGCTVSWNHGDSRGTLIDWAWMLRNPGCPLAGE